MDSRFFVVLDEKYQSDPQAMKDLKSLLNMFNEAVKIIGESDHGYTIDLAAPELLFQVTDKVANIAMVHESEFKSQPSQRKSSHMRLVQ